MLLTLNSWTKNAFFAQKMDYKPWFDGLTGADFSCLSCLVTQKHKRKGFDKKKHPLCETVSNILWKGWEELKEIKASLHLWQELLCFHKLFSTDAECSTQG